MGTFSVRVTFEGSNGLAEDVDALVDTGATYTLLPEALLRRLGVTPVERRPFKIASGETVELDKGIVSVGIGGIVYPVPIVFGHENASPLIGATTLEAFGLAADPVSKRLAPVPGLML